MNEQEHIQLVRKFFDNLNAHNLQASEQYVADDVHVIAPGATTRLDKSSSRMYTQSFIDAFPDLHFDIKDIIAQGDKVAVTWTAKGAHKNTLRPLSGPSISPTNKLASVPGCTIYEFKNDKVTRQELYWDMVTLLTQLGISVGQVEGKSMR